MSTSKTIEIRDGGVFCGDRKIEIGDPVTIRGKVQRLDVRDPSCPVLVVTDHAETAIWLGRGDGDVIDLAAAAPALSIDPPDLTGDDLDAFENEITDVSRDFRNALRDLCSGGGGAVVDCMHAVERLAALARRGPENETPARH